MRELDPYDWEAPADEHVADAWTRCRLCGERAAYPGALYCGAVGCAAYEAGVRPTTIQEHLGSLLEIAAGPGPDIEADDLTPIVCLACGGTDAIEVGILPADPRRSGEYRIAACKWCNGGVMTPLQVQQWRRFLNEQRRGP